MIEGKHVGEAFDRADPLSIYEFSRLLIGQSLHSWAGDTAVMQNRKGKGGLGQMVEELFFGYEVNSNREADFDEANVELKCTPLLRSPKDGSLRIKERLVCTMIDYFELVGTRFEDSHLIAKCRLMLLLFYLHVGGTPVYDLQFLYRVLWKLPEKDLLQIKKDYETIAEKVRRGEAHLLSEGDTMYLGACRKGTKGDSPQRQPNSEVLANKRAFSLKPAYMRYVLGHVIESGEDHYTNYVEDRHADSYELVDSSELSNSSFEQIIIDRFRDFIGLDYVEICSRLGIAPTQAKSKYADVAGLIASCGKSKRLDKSEEFLKSGIVMKTVRLGKNGKPKESMSFRNIDYREVYDNDEWTESEAYEIFTGRFMFAVFRYDGSRTITVFDTRRGQDVTEEAYVLNNVFFWTMPPSDLEQASEYWQNIRENVMADNIHPDAFWSLADHRSFHVRPKAAKKTQLAANPNGGECEKYCYWFNAEYVKRIIDENGAE